MPMHSCVPSCFLRSVLALGICVPLWLYPDGANAQSDKVAEARAAAAARPGDVEASIALGRALRRAGIFQAAAAELRRATNTPGGRSGPLAVAVHRELALTFIDQGRFDDAMRACRAIAGVQGGRAMSHACAADAFMIRKRATEALPEVAKAIEADATLYEAKVVEGYAKWQSAAEAEAEAAFKAAVAARPQRPEALVGLGHLLTALNRREEALAAFEKAYAADPDDPVSALSLGAALPSTERAATVLRAAISARPSFGAAHARLADVLLDLGRLDQAEQEARLAIQSGRSESSWHATLGAVLVQRGQFDAALAQAARSLEMIPNNARGRLVEADARVGKREIDLAIEAYQLAFSYDRQNPAVLVRAAAACLANDRATTAAGFAEKATDAFPNWGPAWEVRGDIAAKAGEKADARKYWERALASQGPVNKDAVRRKLSKL